MSKGLASKPVEKRLRTDCHVAGTAIAPDELADMLGSSARPRFIRLGITLAGYVAGHGSFVAEQQSNSAIQFQFSLIAGYRIQFHVSFPYLNPVERTVR